MGRVLIACEYSGIVRDAFIEAGHDAISVRPAADRTARAAYPGRRAGAAAQSRGIWSSRIRRAHIFAIQGLDGCTNAR